MNAGDRGEAGVIDPTESLEIMLQLIDEIERGHGRFSAVSDTFGKADGPKGLRRTVLTSVVRARVSPTVPQIGRSLGYPRQTVQRLADGLVAAGLLVWVDNPDHKTARRLAATQTGEAIYRHSAEISQAWAKTFADRIGRERIALALETLRDIRQMLEADTRTER